MNKTLPDIQIYRTDHQEKRSTDTLEGKPKCCISSLIKKKTQKTCLFFCLSYDAGRCISSIGLIDITELSTKILTE